MMSPRPLAPALVPHALAEWECALDRAASGTGFCLPVLVGDLEADPSSFSALPHKFSGIPVRDTVATMLGLASAVRLALPQVVGLSNSGDRPKQGFQPDPASLDIQLADEEPVLDLDVSAVISLVAGLLRGRSRDPSDLQAASLAQFEAVRQRMQAQWERIQAVLVRGREVGRGAYAVVYGGTRRTWAP